VGVVDEMAIGERFRALAGELDERQRRLWAAAEARSAGRGGIAATARATGIAQDTIRKGIRELESGHGPGRGRVRRHGGGRKRATDNDPGLLEDLERLVDAGTRGDPELPLRWTSKSVRKLAAGLLELGHEVSYRTVARLLRALGYSLQANRKTHEGSDHPDRDAQFELINETAKTALEAGEPVISVDTKKKELIGRFKNGGREWARGGVPVEVNTHDFPSQADGKAIPYGVYDLANDEGWVSVGIDHDTSQFAASSILAWWENLGQQRFPNATTLTITADCGGSNGNRTRLWKTELQRLADHTGLQITVRHFPPGTSKWNKIEHRLFSYISINWRGKPLQTHQTVIELIAATTTKTGLKVYARLDPGTYPDKITISDTQLASVQIERHPFHPEWNYTIKPRR
jgi:transposase